MYAVIISLVFIFTGCSRTSSMNLEPGYKLESKSFTVGIVKDITVQESEIDKETLLKNAIIEELKVKNLLALDGDMGAIELELTITKYAEGNAFKRWLMPGWGATILTVETKMKKAQKIVATSTVEHTVSMGGGYTIGAHEYIFKDVAKNIVEDILKKMQ